jgi:hypothetical protein
MGPEAMMKYINPEEAIKRLAAAQGIDVLNLVKTAETMQQDRQQQMQQAAQQSLVDQAGQLASTPLMDPSKNPQMMEMLGGQSNPQQATAGQEGPPAPSQ